MKAKRQTGADALAAIGHYTRGLPPRNRPQPLKAPSPVVPPRSPVVAPTGPTVASLGLLAPLTVLASLCLGAVALADGGSRSGRPWGGVVFWSAIAVCAVAFAARLAGSRASRVERILTVLAFGLFLYVVKILRDPTGFTYADELVHAYNVDSIVSSHSFFAPNPILPVTPHYPGLETVAAALRLVGVSSTFATGLIVVVLARTMMMLALFLLLERASGSARVAGLGALAYTACPNFVFLDAAFSYEPLALPLAVVAAYAITRWMALKEVDLSMGANPSRRRRRWAWGAAAVMITASVVVTHHITSYLLIVFILGLGRAQREIRRLSRTYASPFLFAVFGLAAVLVWLVFFARSTWNYLTPVLSDAVRSSIDIITGHQGGRALFSNQQDATPIWDRISALAAAGLVAVGLPFGLRRVWRDFRTNPVCIVLAVAAAGYLVSLGLRLVPAAWETANRSSEFLFIGVGLVLALAGLDRWRPRVMPWAGQLAVALAFAVMLEGGMVSGWSSNIMLAQTTNVAVAGTEIHPQGFAAAAWANSTLGPDRRFAADASNARLLAAYAHEFAIAGTNPDVQSVIRDPKLDAWHIRLLRRYGIRYVLVDRRKVSEDALAGYFFTTDISPPSWFTMFDAKSVRQVRSAGREPALRQREYRRLRRERAGRAPWFVVRSSDHSSSYRRRVCAWWGALSAQRPSAFRARSRS